jgi:hypothetical protein
LRTESVIRWPDEAGTCARRVIDARPHLARQSRLTCIREERKGRSGEWLTLLPLIMARMASGVPGAVMGCGLVVQRLAFLRG